MRHLISGRSGCCILAPKSTGTARIGSSVAINY